MQRAPLSPLSKGDIGDIIGIFELFADINGDIDGSMSPMLTVKN
jgi:hypothetical protein